MRKSEFIRALNSNVEVRDHLFEKGYLIVNNGVINESNVSKYPFYGNWSKTTIGKYDFWVYKSVNLFSYESDGKTFFLIGI